MVSDSSSNHHLPLTIMPQRYHDMVKEGNFFSFFIGRIEQRLRTKDREYLKAAFSFLDKMRDDTLPCQFDNSNECQELLERKNRSSRQKTLWNVPLTPINHMKRDCCKDKSFTFAVCRNWRFFSTRLLKTPVWQFQV